MVYSLMMDNGGYSEFLTEEQLRKIRKVIDDCIKHVFGRAEKKLAVIRIEKMLINMRENDRQE